MTSQVLQEKPKTNAFSGFIQFWEAVKAIAGPYWYPTKPGERAFSDVIRAWGMLILLILLIIALVATNAFNSFVNRYLVDSLIQDKDYSKFTNILSVNIAVLVLVTLLVGLSNSVRNQVALDWYKWLNDKILHKYLSNRAYYKINFRSDIDNPDQRISQEIQPITSSALSFSATLLDKVLTMITYLTIIWTISQEIAVIMLIYTIIGNFIAAYLNQGLNRINQKSIGSQADYNSALSHFRSHAESIAFFQGEKQELNIIQRRFNKIIKNTEDKIGWEKWRDIFSRGYQSVIQIFPFLVLAPLYIRSEIDFGELGQAALACNMFAIALGELIIEFGVSGQFSSYVERLTEFSDALQKVTEQPENVSTIKTIEENHIAFEHVTLQTPDYEQVIVKDLSLSVQPGEGLLIVGASGRGKSSLLRAIAGLWNAGSGRLVRPPLEEVLFLPQRPYIILGTLREQLLYPKTNRQMSNRELKEVLQQVNLQNLLERVDGFDTEEPWENILSLGEQQRLAFARLLITHPSFTILDEATSALDLDNEGHLYQQLQQTNTTFISVGHRESLFNYHQWVLELLQESGWRLLTVEDYRQEKAKEIVTNLSDDAQITIDVAPNNESQTQPQIRAATPTEEGEVEEESNPASTLLLSTSAQDIPPSSVPPAVDSSPSVEGLSHKQMQVVTDYSLTSIRSRASQGKTITTKDGFTYRYNKNPNVLKWERV